MEGFEPPPEHASDTSTDDTAILASKPDPNMSNMINTHHI